MRSCTDSLAVVTGAFSAAILGTFYGTVGLFTLYFAFVTDWLFANGSAGRRGTDWFADSGT